MVANAENPSSNNCASELSGTDTYDDGDYIYGIAYYDCEGDNGSCTEGTTTDIFQRDEDGDICFYDSEADLWSGDC
jgi:hypothetical protein